MIPEQHISNSIMADAIEVKRLCDEYHNSQNINNQVDIFAQIGQYFHPNTTSVQSM